MNPMTVPKAHYENISEIADFVELECLSDIDAILSVSSISSMIQREHGSEDNPLEDLNDNDIVIQAFEELVKREKHVGSNNMRYPFEISDNGKLLCIKGQLNADDSSHILYLFLLLATRLNMNSERSQGGEDATKLFELLSCEVALRYWGGPGRNATAIVFGTGGSTGRRSSFQNRIDNLCHQLGEGVRFENSSGSRVAAQDGRLDIVVWRRFADKREGQLIGFGQCKTGTNWQRDLTNLRPDDFCRNWVFKQPAVYPVRLYFIADRVNRVRDRWYGFCLDGGILIDRCRVIEYAEELPVSLLSKIVTWVNAAASSQGLSLP